MIPTSIRKSRKTGARTVSRIHFFSVLTSKVKSRSNFRLRYFSPSKFKILPRDSAGQFVSTTKLVGSVQGTVRSPSLAEFSHYLPSYGVDLNFAIDVGIYRGAIIIIPKISSITTLLNLTF